MPTCAVASCKNSESNTKNVSFFRFPQRDANLRATWLHRCSRQDSFPWETARMCSEHFLESDYDPSYLVKSSLMPGVHPWLKADAVPSQKLTIVPSSSEWVMMDIFHIDSVYAPDFQLDIFCMLRVLCNPSWFKAAYLINHYNIIFLQQASWWRKEIPAGAQINEERSYRHPGMWSGRASGTAWPVRWCLTMLWSLFLEQHCGYSNVEWGLKFEMVFHSLASQTGEYCDLKDCGAML